MQSIKGEYIQYKETLDKGKNYTDVVGTALSIASIVFGTLVYTRDDCKGLPMVPICMIGILLSFFSLKVGNFLKALFMNYHCQFSKSFSCLHLFYQRSVARVYQIYTVKLHKRGPPFAPCYLTSPVLPSCLLPRQVAHRLSK